MVSRVLGSFDQLLNGDLRGRKIRLPNPRSITSSRATCFNFNESIMVKTYGGAPVIRRIPAGRLVSRRPDAWQFHRKECRFFRPRPGGDQPIDSTWRVKSLTSAHDPASARRFTKPGTGTDKSTARWYTTSHDDGSEATGKNSYSPPGRRVISPFWSRQARRRGLRHRSSAACRWWTGPSLQLELDVHGTAVVVATEDASHLHVVGPFGVALEVDCRCVTGIGRSGDDRAFGGLVNHVGTFDRVAETITTTPRRRRHLRQGVGGVGFGVVAVFDRFVGGSNSP